MCNLMEPGVVLKVFIICGFVISYSKINCFEIIIEKILSISLTLVPPLRFH